MRAIPKLYSGVRFRSTLEADWASNLDRLGMRWQYEPEGVVLSNGQFYRPDLYLPLLSTNVEVKGPHDERIHKPHLLAGDTMHAPGCAEGKPVQVHDDQIGDCACGFGPKCPWRLAIIPRPATNGTMCVEGVGCPEHPRPNLVLARCAECESYSFTDLTGVWWCRRCHQMGKVAITKINTMSFVPIDHKAGQYKRRKKTSR